ncbi:hypothetical protein V8F20_006791 [Naviculisporaceae sp. PSN 640]
MLLVPLHVFFNSYDTQTPPSSSLRSDLNNMTIRERWRRIRAGKLAAGGTKTADEDNNVDGMSSPPQERLSPTKTAFPLRLCHRPQSGEESSDRSPNRNFFARTLTWRFNNHITTDDTSQSEHGEPRPPGREGGKTGHRRKPSKYPGRSSPPPLQAQPESRLRPQEIPGRGITPATQENHISTTPTTPTKKLKAHCLHHKRVSVSTTASSTRTTTFLQRTFTSPKDKGKTFSKIKGKGKGIRQRQREREREREINRHIFGPEQQEHQELLKSYTFPGRKGFDNDEGHDGDDEGCFHGHGHGQGGGGERGDTGEERGPAPGQHRRKSSNISPYSCSRPGSVSDSTVSAGTDNTGARNVAVGMGGFSLGEMGMMGHWTRDLNDDGPWGGFEVSEDRRGQRGYGGKSENVDRARLHLR